MTTTLSSDLIKITNKQKDNNIFKSIFSQQVWEETYKYHTDLTVQDTFRRVAKAIASVEKTKEQREEWESHFYDLLNNFTATPGGRIIANAGTDFSGVTLLNCFVGPRPEYDIDSLDGILDVLRTQAQTLKSEGGWGMNFSFIRPRGSFIFGIGVETPGAIKYMELFDKSSEIITAGSGKKSHKKGAKHKIRKGAMMGSLCCWHPDVLEFITAKQTEGRLTKFNMSVNCSNEFMDKIILINELKKNNASEDEIKKVDTWDLIFPDTQFKEYKTKWDGDINRWKNQGYPVIVHKTVSVTELWNTIISSTYSRNEPGVLFGDIANKTHCWNYGGSKAHISTSNPCGEQTMPLGSVCDLGSLNLTQFINKEKTNFDLEKIKKYIKYLVRFLDNVNDCTKVPLKEYEFAIKHMRRIGCGIFGWGSSLYLLKIKFGSDEAEQIKEELMKTICYTAIETSIDLAMEKGMFPLCEPEKHAESYFFKQIGLPENLKKKIKKYGMRNSSLFSIQPTGNTAVFANITSSGIEPLFMQEYIRTVIVSHVPEHIKNVCPNYLEGEFKETNMFKYAKEGDEVILKGMDEFGVVYKLDKNRGLTKEVLCEDYAVRALKEIGEWDPTASWAATTTNLTVDDHVRDLSGFAKYCDAAISKTVNFPNEYPFKDFENVYLTAYQSGVIKGLTTYRAGTMTTVLSAKNDKKEEKPKIQKTNAPKRPKMINCDVHHIKVTKKLDKVRTFDYVVIVGKLDDNIPYEVFVMENGFLDKKYISGKIEKVKRGQYNIVFDDGYIIEHITKNTTEEEDMVTRLVSMSLRHGADIAFIVQQLEKAHGGDMFSFSRAISRTLKKYIKDELAISGEQCPECGKESLQRTEGCKKCSNCNYTACG